MKKPIIGRIIVLALGMLASQSILAQGTITYLSNLGQTSSGSSSIGSDSWLAATFFTGNNAGGYALNNIQLAMTGASGIPSGFTVMLYGEGSVPGGALPGSSLGSLSGSVSPATTGTYTYTAPPDLILSSSTAYFIVLTAGTTAANGAYEWSLAGADSYNPSGGWAVIQGASSGVYGSDNGSSWNSISGEYPQFAVNATPTPEPSVMSLLGMGGLIFGLCRWKKSG